MTSIENRQKRSKHGYKESLKGASGGDMGME